MMWRKPLALLLILCLSCGLFAASPLPSLPPGSVILSATEYAAIEAALLEAQEALDKSSMTIKRQQTALAVLWISCATLAALLAGKASQEFVLEINKGR